MGLFRKADPRASQAAAIAGFWQWWAGAREQVADSIAAGTSQTWADAFGEQVNAIDRGLEWELTPGREAKHCLVVTAAGKPEQRAVAARWQAAAPCQDSTWEYRSTRHADMSVFESTLHIGGVELALAELRYAIHVDKDHSHIDVVCHHPRFGELPEGACVQVTYLSLDWLLGEDAVETWIGEVSHTAESSENLRVPMDLRYAVDAIAQDDRWALMSGKGRDGSPRMATVNMPLKAARWPRFDLHVAVVLPYRTVNEGQLPIGDSLTALRAFEDTLSAAVGADGEMVAHETGKRERVLHFYVDSQSAAPAVIESHARSWAEGRARVDSAEDPGFQAVRHLSGQ